MTAIPKIHEGRCLCGRVSFRAEGPPEWVSHCHCESCRRTTAAAMATYAGFESSAVAWIGDVPAVYKSSPGVKRQFCRNCGTSVSFESDRWPGELHLFVTTMNDPGAFIPDRHTYVGERIPWMHLADDLPQYQTTSDRNVNS